MHFFQCCTPLVAALALISSTALAQTTATTDPVGFVTLTVAGKPTGIRGFTYLSLSMARTSVFSAQVPVGGVATVSGVTVLTFPAGIFTANQFSGAGNSHYLEITGGSFAGHISDITSNSSTQITLADDISTAITEGSTTVRVRPNWTFATAFGANNSAGFQGGTSSSTADVIEILNPKTGVSSKYFYSTTNNRWQTGFTDATNAPIPPDAGLRIERKGTASVSFKLVGDVKLGPTGLLVEGGSSTGNYNLIPNPYPLASKTLANSGLYTGNPNTGLVGGSSSSSADTLALFNPATGTSINYFFSTTNNRWQTGFTDASNVTIPEGSAVMVTRKNARPSFVWYVPQPTMN